VRVDAHTSTDAGRLRFLQSPGSAGPAKDDGTLAIFHAGGADAEVDEVFRRILASGLPLDHVELVCALDLHALLAREKATLLDWGVTLSSGVPATMTRPGRLLLRFCDWVASDFAARDLRRLLQSGDCAPRAFADGDSGLSPGQAARLLLKAEATWGRKTYAPSLTRLAEQYDRRAKDPEQTDDDRSWNQRKAAHTTALRQWIESVLSNVPEPASGGGGAVALTSLVQCATDFLEANSARANALDAMAYAAVTAALADLLTMGSHRCGLEAGLKFLRERVASLTVGRDRPRPGCLHVSTLADAGYDGRPLVFVVGLQEGGVFPAAVEDPVLLDDERTAIQPLLRTSAQRQDEAVFSALSRLATVGVSAERVCLSFSCRDTRDFRETFPSWIVLQAYRLMKGDASRNYEHLRQALGEPVSSVPASAAAAVDNAGWWLANTKATSAARDAILEAYPSLARGIHAESERASTAFTEYDGYVAIAGPVLDPSRTGRAVSATTLEKAAQCPLRYFIEHGLGVKVVEDADPDEDVWLDAATRGGELHELFARVMRAIRAEKRKSSLTVDRPRLRKMGQERLDQLRVEMPPSSDEVFARESREFLDDLDAFIEAECEGLHGTDPLGFEVSFGFRLEPDEEEPLASAEPTVIDLGDKRRMVLHGRIDRINRVEPGKYEVVDYKTGGYWPDNWKGEFAGGTRLQHAIYGVAAAELLRPADPKARVVQGVYLFPAVKGRRRRKLIKAPSKMKLADVLRDLADVIGSGAFVSADAEERCKWCDFASACHAADVNRAVGKIAGDTSAALEPYRRLRGNHE
jgi:ATP-dependent helicase/nuclease subunit B